MDGVEELGMSRITAIGLFWNEGERKLGLGIAIRQPFLWTMMMMILMTMTMMTVILTSPTLMIKSLAPSNLLSSALQSVSLAWLNCF